MRWLLAAALVVAIAPFPSSASAQMRGGSVSRGMAPRGGPGIVRGIPPGAAAGHLPRSTVPQPFARPFPHPFPPGSVRAFPSPGTSVFIGFGHHGLVRPRFFPRHHFPGRFAPFAFSGFVFPYAYSYPYVYPYVYPLYVDPSLMNNYGTLVYGSGPYVPGTDVDKLGSQIEDLSNEIEQLQEQNRQLEQQLQQRSAGTASASAPEERAAAPARQTTVLVFRDGHRREVGSYAISGDTLWVLNEQTAEKIPLSALDLQQTREVNKARGVDFPVLPGPARDP